MNVTLKHLRAFVAVAHARGFTRAAETCGLSQPALTVAIRQLEETLGTALFERTTRRVRLTADGGSFLPAAERLLTEFDNAIGTMRAGAAAGRERVSVAALPSMAVLALPDAAAALVRLAPGTRVHVRDSNSSAVQRRVRAGEVDFGLGTLWEADADIQVEPLLSDCFGLVCRGDHPLMHTASAPGWTDLADYPVLGLAMDTGIRPLLQRVPDLPASVLNPMLEFSNITTIGAMLSRNLGITVLPYMAFACLKDDGLRFRLLAGPPIRRTIGLLRRRGTPLGPAAAKFRALLADSCGRLATEAPEIEDCRPADLRAAALDATPVDAALSRGGTSAPTPAHRQEITPT